MYSVSQDGRRDEDKEAKTAHVVLLVTMGRNGDGRFLKFKATFASLS